jgi:hypothetical protein
MRPASRARHASCARPASCRTTDFPVRRAVSDAPRLLRPPRLLPYDGLPSPSRSVRCAPPPAPAMPPAVRRTSQSVAQCPMRPASRARHASRRTTDFPVRRAVSDAPRLPHAPCLPPYDGLPSPSHRVRCAMPPAPAMPPAVRRTSQSVAQCPMRPASRARHASRRTTDFPVRRAVSDATRLPHAPCLPPYDGLPSPSHRVRCAPPPPHAMQSVRVQHSALVLCER